MGRAVAPVVAGRFGRLILELGGNNGAIVAPSADLELAVRGDRLLRRRHRRPALHEPAPPDRAPVRARRARRPARQGLRQRPHRRPAGRRHPRRPAHRRPRVRPHRRVDQDGRRRRRRGRRPAATGCSPPKRPTPYYVTPALVTMPAQTEIVRTETFGPLLYVLAYDDFDEAVALHNAVPQGLASSVFTNDVREAERFVSVGGLGLRDRQRQHRPVRCRDRRRVRRREGDRRRPRVGLRRLEVLHAPGDEHRQLLHAPSPSPRASSSTSEVLTTPGRPVPGPNSPNRSGRTYGVGR